MAVFRLTRQLRFPDPGLADADGLLAVGGDLSVKRLLLAYSMGIFPWFSDDSPILWWSPDPRLVLLPGDLRITRSLRRTLKKNVFTVTFDRAFREVITACSCIPRRDGQGTWITPEMINAYCQLHEAGHAHSVESWHEGRLAGGLYGVALGSAFFGESMFSRATDASKVALVHLVRRLVLWDFRIIDCQVTSAHMMSMGAHEMSRPDFLRIIGDARLQTAAPQGNWERCTAD